MRYALGGATAVVFLAAATGSALAGDTTAKDAIRSDLHQEIASAEEPLDEIGWFGPNFHLHKKSGFAYTRHVSLAERPFVFRIQGPVLKNQEAVGLAFKIRF